MMKIIQANTEHLDMLVPLFDAYRQFYQQKSDIKSARKYLTERMQLKQSVIYMAVSDAGKGMGFVQLYPSFSSVSMQRLWILNDLFVEAKARKQGVGEALMQQAKDWAIATQAKGLILETGKENTSAQRLYEKLGYVRGTEYYSYYLAI